MTGSHNGYKTYSQAISYGCMKRFEKGMVFETCPLSKCVGKNTEAFVYETINISLR
jgi:hypothetical protein